jgi:23S rRNA pseudouridine1911/1915/1917 synthase
MTASRESAAPAAGYQSLDTTSAPPPLMPPVLFEDERLLAVDKPAGLVTHPAYKHPNGTLCDAIFARQAARGESRPWLLHRLDRETSGVVLFAKTEPARRALVRQFERRSVRKRYLAVTVGVPGTPDGVIEAPLARDPADRRRTIVVAGGQPATTRYRVLAARAGCALVLAEPLTGRTHQIRAHLAHLGTPLLGDARYASLGGACGSSRGHPAGQSADRALLHAWRLGVRYPGTGEPLEISAPLPADFAQALARLGLEGALDSLGSLDSLSLS